MANELPSLLASQETKDDVGKVLPEPRFFAQEAGGERSRVLYESGQPVSQLEENTIVVRTTWSHC